MFSYQNKRFLIVDDQKTFHVMLKTMLTNQGAKNITFADTVDAAVKIAQRKEFDIYLIDYNLGAGKNGSQLLEYLRDNKLIPTQALCFIITGDSNRGMVLSAIEKAPDDYLMKPFSQTLLFNRLSKAAQKKNALAPIFSALNAGDTQQAIAQCRNKITQGDKFSHLCRSILADIFISIEDFTAAEQLLSAEITRRPLVRTCISLGKVYYLQQDYAKAIETLNDVIMNHPLQMDAYQWLSRAYRASGDLDKALQMLSHTANITHHSIEKHQEVAQLAQEVEEHQVMLKSYQAILQLSRNSFYPDPCHLANYIRSIFRYAETQEEIIERNITLKRVSSTLYQSRYEEGRNKGFDFNSYDQICQAQVFFSQGDSLKAKRRILSTLDKIERDISEIDNTLLCTSLFSLIDIGEFDYAAPYLEELTQRDILDSTTQLAIQKYTGDTLQKRINSFKIHNKLGIAAFEGRHLDAALEHFNAALILEPLNSGALLNRAQVYIELLRESTREMREERLNRCQESFKLLSNTHLPDGHAQRYKRLYEEFVDLKRS